MRIHALNKLFFCWSTETKGEALEEGSSKPQREEPPKSVKDGEDKPQSGEKAADQGKEEAPTVEVTAEAPAEVTAEVTVEAGAKKGVVVIALFPGCDIVTPMPQRHLRKERLKLFQLSNPQQLRSVVKQASQKVTAPRHLP